MTTVISINDVKKETAEFFRMHWNLNIPIPAWNDKYSFQGAVPDGDKQGCYALLINDEVVYIGLGASKGSGIYKEHGIGARLINHVIVWNRSIPAPISERKFKLKDKWHDITDIYTIGFPSGSGYLACALESFLLSRLNPVRNIVGRI